MNNIRVEPISKVYPIHIHKQINQTFHIPKLIGVASDFDETLVNSGEVVVALANQDYGYNVNWKDVKKYNFSDVYPNLKWEILLAYFEDDRFFEMLKLKPNSLEFLSQIAKDGFKIKIPTIGTKENLRKKEIWINQNIKNKVPQVEFIGIEKTRGQMGKSMIDLNGYMLIDDHKDNLNSSNATEKVLFLNNPNADWNIGWQGKSVNNISQCYKWLI